MKFNLRAVAFAAAALAAGGAQADIFNVATGDGSVYFVAIDADANIAFTADLGMRLSDFTNSTTFTSGLAAPVTWNFATNVVSTDFAGTEAWSTAYDTFKATQTGSNFLWGVVSGDNVSAGTVTNRNTLSTGNATQAQMLVLTTTAPISNALTAFAGWEAASNGKGNIAAAATNGAAALTSSSGGAWLNASGAIFGNFNGTNTWNYLLANGVSSTFQRAQQATGGVITQFGNPNAVDSLAANPITFTFDIATNTLVLAAAPIPEPGTYAMLLAGLSAVGFMVRRRKA
jgi:hypothetical protein